MSGDDEGRLIVSRGLRGAALLAELVEGARGGGFGEGLVETPVPALAEVLEQRAKLLEAARYLLTRVQTDAEIGYVLGPCTEAWERLVTAEALALGHDREVRRVDRMRDLRAPHCRRDPRVVELEARVEELEEQLREARSL